MSKRASGPIRLGLARIGITDVAVISAALERIGAEVRTVGLTGARWRLAR